MFRLAFRLSQKRSFLDPLCGSGAGKVGPTRQIRRQTSGRWDNSSHSSLGYAYLKQLSNLPSAATKKDTEFIKKKYKIATADTLTMHKIAENINYDINYMRALCITSSFAFAIDLPLSFTYIYYNQFDVFSSAIMVFTAWSPILIGWLYYRTKKLKGVRKNFKLFQQNQHSRDFNYVNYLVESLVDYAD